MKTNQRPTLDDCVKLSIRLATEYRDQFPVVVNGIHYDAQGGEVHLDESPPEHLDVEPYPMAEMGEDPELLYGDLLAIEAALVSKQHPTP